MAQGKLLSPTGSMHITRLVVRARSAGDIETSNLYIFSKQAVVHDSSQHQDLRK
jgi:hypothetical protein